MPAEEFQQVRHDLAFWQAYEPAVKSDLSCCARRFGNELIFIDPIPLAKSALAELTADATPVAIVVTNGNHARAAAEFRDRFSIPILAHAAAELEIAVDQLLEEGSSVFGHLKVIEIAVLLRVKSRCTPPMSRTSATR